MTGRNPNSLANLRPKKIKKGEKIPGCGRKKSMYKQIVQDLEIFGEQLSNDDYYKIVRLLLTTDVDSLKDLTNKKETPIIIIIIINSLIGDMKRGQLVNSERLLDRILGKATQKTDVTTNGKDILTQINIVDKTGLFNDKGS